MPTWTNEPPDPSDATPFRIIRTPATGKLLAIITSDEVIGTNTHFYNHRTLPCEGATCPACGDGYPWRWHGYVTALDPLTREHFLFEFPAAANDAFKAYRTNQATVRGCHFLATRAPQRHNGRVMIRCKPADLEREPIPSAPNLRKILCKLWSIPYTEIETPDRLKGHPFAQRVKTHDPSGGNGRSNSSHVRATTDL